MFNTCTGGWWQPKPENSEYCNNVVIFSERIHIGSRGVAGVEKMVGSKL